MAVKQQIRKIRHLKKYQPKYKHAHEKAVFKAAAIVKDTKNIVKDIDHQVGNWVYGNSNAWKVLYVIQHVISTCLCEISKCVNIVYTRIRFE